MSLFDMKNKVCLKYFVNDCRVLKRIIETYYLIRLKSDSHLSKNLFLSTSINALQMRKNAFYFMLIVFMVLKILTFLC